MKVVYSDPKTGLTAQKEVSDEILASLIGAKIGDVVDGSLFGLNGCKLKITGGSDDSGFGMEKSVSGSMKVGVLRRIANAGKDKGQYERVTVAGNTINEKVVQLNTMIVDYGNANISEMFPKKEKAENEKEAEKK
ncbi:30S ribosomal protein S6e [Candidatus Mancarchaeum acidiphilum]|uniref:30S ribosomal protein S6e n=1 Tax=Candidatus Mancarchaeum acidiphilum TaxID=1920749 RepID=A0A218NML6_9ARCH|nr:S6e family ribosomal protein [Candidatus Mancarchaeum acidiphilum]ASI13702.1 30S ribosomal protein S6e [Candidatus Mancarchaeum acidiphilum]